MDRYLYGKSSYHYIFILPRLEKINLIKQNSRKLIPLLKGVFLSGVKNLIKKKSSHFGNYDNKFFDVLAIKKSMDKRLSFQFYKNDKINEFSELNILYLNKIAALCKEKNINIVLLKTPLHPYYKKKIPIEYLEKYDKIIVNNHFEVVDFKDIILNDSCFIPDGDHVSVKGAKITTNELIKYDKSLKLN